MKNKSKLTIRSVVLSTNKYLPFVFVFFSASGYFFLVIALFNSGMNKRKKNLALLLFLSRLFYRYYVANEFISLFW